MDSSNIFSYIYIVNKKDMTEQQVQKIINEVYPKIEKHYGYSKFIPECTPYVETHYNIYADIVVNQKLKVRKINVMLKFDRTDNSIVIYYPNMKSRNIYSNPLVHEYQHYLQSPSWFKRDIMIWDIIMVIIHTRFRHIMKKKIGNYLDNSK